MANVLNGTISSNGLNLVKANIDNTQFNKIKTGNKSLNTTNPVMPVANANIWKNGTSSIPSTWAGVNAVDIDWNSAKITIPANAEDEINEFDEITTTGQLLSIIGRQQAQINALILMVKGIYAGLAQN